MWGGGGAEIHLIVPLTDPSNTIWFIVVQMVPCDNVTMKIAFEIQLKTAYGTPGATYLLGDVFVGCPSCNIYSNGNLSVRIIYMLKHRSHAGRFLCGFSMKLVGLRELLQYNIFSKPQFKLK